MVNQLKTVAICTATYKRSEMLDNCLSNIHMLALPTNYNVILLIVDNAPEQPSKEITRPYERNDKLPLYYFIESERGIASSRNRLIKEALRLGAELIAFIDDDEYPHSDWLNEHLSVLEKYNADVVAGPVIPVYENGLPKNHIQKIKTGGQPRHVAAGNVVFKTSLTTEDGLWFDESYNLTGGEDFYFFTLSKNKGNKHIWAADAIVYETIPNERTTLKYLFYRHFTGAINNVEQYKSLHGAFLSFPHFIIKAFGKLFGGLISLAFSIITINKNRMEKATIKFASVLGYLSGLCKIHVERYK